MKLYMHRTDSNGYDEIEIYDKFKHFMVGFGIEYLKKNSKIRPPKMNEWLLHDFTEKEIDNLCIY